MSSYLSSLEFRRSENALYVRFSGVHDGYLTARYAEALEQFCQVMQGKAWARIIDLRQWSVTAAESHHLMVALLKQDLTRGLTLEYVLWSDDVMGRWQIERTLKSLNAENTDEVFHPAEDENEALAGLMKQGFSVNFGAASRHESRCWKVLKTLETKS